MESAIMIFSNPQFGDIRTAGTADKPMFCLADLCKAVELTNPSSVKSRLEKEDVQLVDLHALNGGKEIVGNSLATFVTETGFYEVLLASSSPKVRPFRRWVTGEVLPSIRKTGGYIAATNDMTDEEILAKALIVAKSTIERRDQRIKELESDLTSKETALVEASCQISEMSEKIEDMRPKADYYDMILNNRSTVLTTQIAQDYGMSAKAFNKMLRDMGIQRKVGEQWVLYSKYIGQGYVHSKPIDIIRTNGMRDVKYNTEWTQKGRLFLYGKLKDNGILPMIEQ